MFNTQQVACGRNNRFFKLKFDGSNLWPLPHPEHAWKALQNSLLSYLADAETSPRQVQCVRFHKQLRSYATPLAGGDTQSVTYDAFYTHVTARGTPKEPVFDDLLMLMELDKKKSANNKYAVGRAVTFVSISYSARARSDDLLVFWHRYCAVARVRVDEGDASKGKTFLWDPFDPRAKAKSPPVALLRPAIVPNKQGLPWYGLDSTESISSGAWLQENFVKPGQFWYIKNKKPT
jgi:hypothetical protein